MKSGDYLAIWLHEPGAKAFLGLRNEENASVCRWLVLGAFTDYEAHMGIWVKLDRLEQWSPDGNKVLWAVTPQTCMIRWEFIIHAQLLRERPEDSSEIGFRQQPKPAG